MQQDPPHFVARSSKGLRFGVAKTSETGSGLVISFRGPDYALVPLALSVACIIVSAFVFFTGGSQADTEFAVIYGLGALVLLGSGAHFLFAYRSVELDFDHRLLTLRKHRLIFGSQEACDLDSLVIARCRVQAPHSWTYKYSGLILAADVIRSPLLYACDKGEAFALRALAEIHPKLAPFVVEDSYNVRYVFP
ncbi:MAG: hypothetical protein H6813_07645 [Phycisphaeraceae bacterium]|nr:hypothetical protein [Phycisphaeraceae bacterium]MCB9848369.1 hypothetical protein [Phycisphaeraceae bacterium]